MNEVSMPYRQATSSVMEDAFPRLGVVVPLGNEEDTIEIFLERVCRQIQENDRVFCVLDNVSTDGTRGIVEAYGERDARVLLVWAPENRSVVDAYFRGYEAALAANCAWILEMDGGLSHLPEEIPRFLKAMSTGIDFAAGSRFTNGGSHRGSVYRYLVSRGGTLLANWVLGTRMSDMTSGFECFTHEALQCVVEQGVESRAHFFQTEIRYMLHDWDWIEIPITYANPSKGVGSASLKESLRNLWHLRRHRTPSPTST